MKNFIKSVLVFSLLLQSIDSPAQDIEDESRFSVGVKIGINLSNTSLEKKSIEDSDKKAKAGLIAGISMEYAMTDNFYLQSGLMFTIKGMKLEGTSMWIPSGETRWKQTVNMQYLQIPLMAAYKFNISSNTKLFVQAGPYFAYGIGGSSKLKNKYYDLGDKEPDEEKFSTFGNEGLKRFDFGLTGGIGVEFGDIIVGLSYEHGLIDINQKDNKINRLFDESKCMNRSGSLSLLSLGYRF